MDSTGYGLGHMGLTVGRAGFCRETAGTRRIVRQPEFGAEDAAGRVPSVYARYAPDLQTVSQKGRQS